MEDRRSAWPQPQAIAPMIRLLIADIVFDLEVLIQNLGWNCFLKEGTS